MSENKAIQESVGQYKLVRGTICHLISDPFYEQDETRALEVFEDGGLVIDSTGRVLALGAFAQMAKAHPAARLIDRSGCLILPGLIDCHIHFPQTLVVGAFGEELIDWLNKHMIPEEAKFHDPEYAATVASIFFQELIAQGTTTALIFGAHFEQATKQAFAEAHRRGFRALMGMTLSDRLMAPALLSDPPAAYAASKRLIDQWHNKGKLRYVVTPRFAPTCSPSMLEVCRELLREHPDAYLQTHLNENHREIAWVRELFPFASSYLDVYDRHGLLGRRSLFAHSVHSSDAEIARLSETECRVIHCPSSNSFLGSGLLPLKKYVDRRVIVALGSDIGGGTGYSLLQEMNQAYKVQMLQMFALGEKRSAVKLSGIKLLYLGTLAGAVALSLEGEIGSLQVGRCADFLVIDPERDTFFKARLKNTSSVGEQLFLLGILGSKQLIGEVYTDGVRVYQAA